MKSSVPVILIVGLIAAGSILAQPSSYRYFRGAGKAHKSGNFHQRSANPFRFKSLDRIYDKRNQLNLTDEQVGKIKSLVFEFRSAQTDRKAAIEKSQIKLRHLKSDKSASMQSIMDAIDEMHRLEAEREKALYRFRTEVRSILTEEQFKKLEKLRSTRRSNVHRFLPPIEREIVFDDYLESQ